MKGSKMKPALRMAVAALFVSIVSLSAHAQVPYAQGPVERVTLISILPGHSDAFFADIKANVIPLWESEKTAGLITGYQIFLNQTTSNPDWDLGFAIVYKDMAALDGLPDKVYDLRMKHYGDKSSEQKVIDKRVENAKVVSSMLLRDITVR
jgi:hypothetical protein